MPEAVDTQTGAVRLEVVGDADHRIVDVVVAVGVQVWAARQAEIGNFGDDAAVFRADIEAGADLVGDAAAIKTHDSCLPFGVDSGGGEIANLPPEKRAAASFQKGIEVVEVEVVDVCRADFLSAVIDLDAIGIGVSVVVDVVLRVGVVGLYRAARCEHEAVAEQRAQTYRGADRNIGGAVDMGLDHARSADAEVLTAFLGSACDRSDGEQEYK